jgi:hypothetical protein
MKFIYFLFLFINICTDSIYHIINEKKSYIFKQMRELKKVLPKETHSEVEALVKDMELKYIISKDGFIEHLYNLHNSIPNNINQQEDIHELLTMLELIRSNIKSLPNNKHAIGFINEQEPLVRDMLLHHIEKGNPYLGAQYNNITTFIEMIPSYILGESDDGVKVNSDFGNFLKMLNDVYNIDSVKMINDKVKKKEAISDIINGLKDEHRNWFSSFLEEYINESVITNENLKAKYTKKKMKEMDLNKLRLSKRGETFRFRETTDLDKNKTQNETAEITKEQAINESDDLKSSTFNINKPGSSDIDTDLLMNKTGELIANNSELISSSQTIQEHVAKVSEQIRKDNEEKLKGLQLTGTCKEKIERLESVIANSKKAEEERLEQAQELMKDIPGDLMNSANDPNASQDFIKQMILDFVIKLIEMIIKHIPFYFFKICIPPGPLVFGCCPEAAFFPTQIYNLFTALERVDKFKQTAKAFPGWLEEIGKENIGESDYYKCAQGYLTLEESNLFSRCNILSLVYNNPLNFLGIMPGDSPLCFWACLQVISIITIGCWAMRCRDGCSSSLSEYN